MCTKDVESKSLTETIRLLRAKWDEEDRLRRERDDTQTVLDRTRYEMYQERQKRSHA